MAYLTTSQAARELGITPDRVRELALAGTLPAVRHGNSGSRWSIDLAEAITKWRNTKPTKRSHNLANACCGTLSRGWRSGAERQYRRLTSDMRARVDAWCLKRGIPSPGLQLRPIPPAPPRPVDMTSEGAD